MNKFLRLFVCVIVLLASACQSLQTATAPESKPKQALVDGVTLNYLDEGQGVPVVFVHGAFSDRRNWEAQRAAVSKQYRYIALDQRYFGAAPWSDGGSRYSVATHANDLAVFIEQLNAGPVNVVGWSYGGAVAVKSGPTSPRTMQILGRVAAHH